MNIWITVLFSHKSGLPVDNIACTVWHVGCFDANISLQRYITYITEQQFSQIEKQLISCNAKLESERKQHERLQKEHEVTGKSKVYSDFFTNLEDCTGKVE